MITQSNGRTVVYPTHKVFSNLSRKRIATPTPRSKTPKRAVRSAKSIKPAVIRSRSAGRAGRVLSVPKDRELWKRADWKPGSGLGIHPPRVSRPRVPPRRSGDDVACPIVMESMENACRSVMGQYFPAIYRNAVAAGETANAPVTPLTVTDRIQTSTQANGAVFSSTMQISPCMYGHVIRSATWAAGVVATEISADSSSAASVAALGYRYRCTGMEVVVESTAASSAIQGEWAVYCFPSSTTIVGSPQNVFNAAQAARGFFTDGKPSLRYILFKLDEVDDDWLPMSTVGGSLGETGIRVDIQTAATTTLTVFVTTTWTVTPNPVGQAVMPGSPVLIDQAAYQRGIQAFGDMINENVAIITDPTVADRSQPGILGRVASAVATTVGEAKQLQRALSGAWELASAVTGAFTSAMDMDLDVLGSMVSMSSSSLYDRLKKRDEEAKESLVPPDLLAALKILSRYQPVRSKRGNTLGFEPTLNGEISSVSTVVLANTTKTRK